MAGHAAVLLAARAAAPDARHVQGMRQGGVRADGGRGSAAPTANTGTNNDDVVGVSDRRPAQQKRRQ